MTSHIRRKYSYPSTATGTITEGDNQNGDTSVEVKSYTLHNESFIEYFVPGDGPCYQTETTSTPLPWSGQVSRTPCYVWWNPHGYSRLAGVLDGLVLDAVPINDLPDLPFSTTALLAKTNPGKPKVSIPNFLAELRDVPKMLESGWFKQIQSNGRSANKVQRFGSAYLEGSFGWGPLISDTLKAFDWFKDVQKRLNFLDRTYSARGASGRMDFGNASGSHTQIGRNMIWGYGDTEHQWDLSQWGTVQWKAIGSPPADNLSRRYKEFLRYFGVGALTPTQVWNAIPWTWMNDWFFNVGDYLQATDNSYGVIPVNIWRHLRLHTSHNDVNVVAHQGMCPSEDTITPGAGSVTFKSYRRISAPAPNIEFSLPILNGGQIATATSLIAQAKRY